MIFSLEFDYENDVVELHLDKEGAENLKQLLERIIKSNKEDHFHLMTKEWGGNELTSEKQNISTKSDLINHFKILYWKDKNNQRNILRE